MKNIQISTLIVLLCATTFTSTTFAEKLPKGATALSAAEVTALYSDHTAVWAPTAMAYFAADGSMKEFVQDLSKPGKWSVKDNEFCMDIQGVDPKSKKLNGKTFTECWQWFKDSKNKLYTLYSKHWDDSKVDKTNFSSKDAENLKPGDLIGAKFVPIQ